MNLTRIHDYGYKVVLSNGQEMVLKRRYTNSFYIGIEEYYPNRYNRHIFVDIPTDGIYACIKQDLRSHVSKEECLEAIKVLKVIYKLKYENMRKYRDPSTNDVHLVDENNITDRERYFLKIIEDMK